MNYTVGLETANTTGTSRFIKHERFLNNELNRVQMNAIYILTLIFNHPYLAVIKSVIGFFFPQRVIASFFWSRMRGPSIISV